MVNINTNEDEELLLDNYQLHTIISAYVAIAVLIHARDIISQILIKKNT